MELLEGFTTLFFGMAIFFVTHLGLGSFGPRRWFIDKLGFMKFRAGHSILSLLGLYFIVIGFGSRPMFPIYYPSYEDYKITGIIMTIALMVLAASFSSKEFKAITRHPMLWSVFIFACAHLNANGDFGSIILFGGFLIYSLLAMYIADRRRVMGNEEGFNDVLKVTSVIPFIALIKGRASWPKGVLWLLKPIVIGFVVAWVIVNNHEYLTGVELIFG